MAFVSRSGKTSPFDVKDVSKYQSSCTNENSQNSNEQLGKENRIHHTQILGESSKKNQANKCHQNKSRPLDIQAKPSFCIAAGVVDQKPNQPRQKFTYSFKNLKKPREYHLCDHRTQPKLKQNQPKINFTLPSTLSNRSFTIKLNKVIQSKNFYSPGPGAYNPKLIQTPKGPKFHQKVFINIDIFRQNKQNTMEAYKEQLSPNKKQKICVVKYNCMNTSCFKKPLQGNKVNKSLADKLINKNNIQNLDQNKQDQEFVLVKTCQPDPATYNIRQVKSKNARKFGKQIRFTSHTSPGANKFYQIQRRLSNGMDESQNSCFCSQVNRFQSVKPLPVPLQYQNYYNSHIKLSKNRKQVPFNTLINRAEKVVIDQRPYYCVQAAQKNQFLTKISKYTSQRNLFTVNNQQFPSPAQYQVFPSWQKLHSVKISPDPQQAQNINKIGSKDPYKTFYMCSSAIMQQKCHQNTKKGVLRLQRLSPPPKPIQPIPQQRPFLYHQILPKWQKKSFNKYFSNQPLVANNPVKGQIP